MVRRSSVYNWTGVILLSTTVSLALGEQPAHSAPKRAKTHKTSATSGSSTASVSSNKTEQTGAAQPDKNASPTPTAKAEARKIQEFQIKAQQSQMRFAEENQRLMQEQLKQTQSVARANLAKSREEDERARLEREANRKAHQRELEEMKLASAQEKPAETKLEAAAVDEGELTFKEQHKDVLHTSFSGPRKTIDRTQLPSLNIKPGQSKNAVAMPVIIKTATGEQRHQAQTFQANLQAQLSAVPGTMTPKNFADNKAFQLNTYLSDYPAYVNHQVISINKKNTYIREVQPTQYPVWYERKPDLTYCNGFVLGSAVQVKSDWFGWDWPAQFGTAPNGFMCQPNYLPTPWFYVTYNDQWRQAGESAYRKGPDPDYSGPISVETVEPITGRFPDKFGVPVSQTFNVIYFYNAFYQPEMGRWGYVNRQGNFVWLNI